LGKKLPKRRKGTGILLFAAAHFPCSFSMYSV
jgi:hypothetical protein